MCDDTIILGVCDAHDDKNGSFTMMIASINIVYARPDGSPRSKSKQSGPARWAETCHPNRENGGVLIFVDGADWVFDR